MFKKRLITISALPFVTALLLGSSLIISNKPAKVSAINDTHEHDDWTGIGVNALPTEAGDYYLTDNITLSATWTVPEGTTKLCLNGYVINANGGNFNAITVPTGATLDLYDCGNTSHNGYLDNDGLWHLGEGEGTAKTITGGIITGGNTTTNGGGVNVSGTFNMYGGNIAGNTAENGGGISNTSSFTMTDGNIVGNTATTYGGGFYASSSIFANILTLLTGGTITDNTATYGGGVYYKTDECFAPGTLITMADGTRQAIETLNIGDSVRVFDHEKGEISSSKIFDVWTYPEKHSGVVKLYFSNDIDVTVVYGHSFFEHEQNKYVAVTRDNVSAFVGHEFYNVDNERWEILEGYEFIDGEVDTYVITTEYQLNCVANGMLSNEDGFYTLLTNIFEYGDNLKIDQVKKEQDIANFGLYSYENIKHMSKYVYDILNFQYLKVAFGKDLITENEFNYLEAYYAEVDPELYCSGKEETPVESKSGLLKAPPKAPLLNSSVSAPDSGFYVSGSTKMLGNKGGNLYLSSGKTITIGTGTGGGGNGVVAPTEDMNIGITLADGTGQFTTNGTANYSSNFFSDKLEYGVKYNSETLGSEYLELVDAYTITNNTKEADKTTNHGYIEVKQSAIEGEEVSINVVPNAGYKLTSLVYNDGTNHNITTALSFEMQTTPVSVTAEFEVKAEQVIEIGDISKIYDGLPINFDQYSSALSYLGDGEVTIEFKVAGASDGTYTTDRPVNAGEYTVRVSVAESSTHSAGVKTKDFTISYAKINKVGFGDISQPVAGETAPTTVQGIAIGSRYAGSISWSPALVDGKFDCKTTYTVTITLDIVPSSIENYVFAEDVVLVKPNSEGWAKSTDSTQSKLVYTKTFANTGIHSLTEVSRKNPTCTEDGYKEAYYCSACEKYFTDPSGEHEIGNLEAYNAWKLNEGKLSARHIVNTVPGVDPTKERSGYKVAYKCSECGQYFEDEACTVLIGDEAAYNIWKANKGYLPQLTDEGLSGGAIAGICVGSILLLLLVIYLIGYFFLYRKGKLDEKKIKVIYKFLSRGKKNLKEADK